ncbi:hypothetical protein RFI_21629 [Reticulomyxa filosa]|uniref:Transmembrane protein n=1 Tax=Reticulomyxa filosa TaxID=46433 RepID=X6MRK8_RETFI|nr:hypothetical protein RFI_21629 [Reticulomyxa filosa]|eukprot:ETO15735.1 hypothetical protein RFI_21629 [Reticulomyxa filosa]
MQDNDKQHFLGLELGQGNNAGWNKKSTFLFVILFQTIIMTMIISNNEKASSHLFFVVVIDIVNKEKNFGTIFELQSEKETKIIIQYWLQILEMKLGWINEFDKIIVIFFSRRKGCYFVLRWQYNVNSGNGLQMLTGYLDLIWDINFLFDGQTIVSYSHDKNHSFMERTGK